MWLSQASHTLPLAGKREEAALHRLLLHQAGLQLFRSQWCYLAAAAAAPLFQHLAQVSPSGTQRPRTAQLHDRPPHAGRAVPVVTMHLPGCQATLLKAPCSCLRGLVCLVLYLRSFSGDDLKQSRMRGQLLHLTTPVRDTSSKSPRENVSPNPSCQDGTTSNANWAVNTSQPPPGSKRFRNEKETRRDQSRREAVSLDL